MPPNQLRVPPLRLPGAAALNERLQEAKREAAQFNRDLQQLEEDLLYPASSQLAVFILPEVGKGVHARLGANPSSTTRSWPTIHTRLHELAALQRGGVQSVCTWQFARGRA